ncbi:hypothetical protein FXN61_24055 [Lentzea sp. PSKA42]|uniref:Uncharacterized protein n=1 Tax=Lentzea indica TaxID=2604800 RepID=A0ABX1FL99_9PSEU|nr:hypothetical protein [Lentzea indica]NKE59717.1 hypothetical protein [Lentzea indica]
MSRTMDDPSGGAISGSLAVNLAPGEESLVVLRIYTELKSVVGELTATVAIVDKEASLKIEGDRNVDLTGASVSVERLRVRPQISPDKKPFICIIGGASGRSEDCSVEDISELANMLSAESGTPLKRPVSTNYQCSVDSLRWPYVLAHSKGVSGAFYLDPIVHACSERYSLVEGGLKGASVFDYFLMERIDSRWAIKLRSGARLDSGPTHVLFPDSELVRAGLDLKNLKEQLGLETSSGRKIFDR